MIPRLFWGHPFPRNSEVFDLTQKGEVQKHSRLGKEVRNPGIEPGRRERKEGDETNSLTFLFHHCGFLHARSNNSSDGLESRSRKRKVRVLYNDSEDLFEAFALLRSSHVE